MARTSFGSERSGSARRDVCAESFLGLLRSDLALSIVSVSVGFVICVEAILPGVYHLCCAQLGGLHLFSAL